MKKAEVVFQFAVAHTFLVLLSGALHAKEFTLQEAVLKNLIQVNMESSGGFSENCVSIKIHNLEAIPLCIVIDPGLILDNLNEKQQDIIVVKKLKMKLYPQETKDTMVYGFCCQSHNGSPIYGQKFRIGKMADTLMVKLCNYLSSHKVNSGIAQSAVWTISDRHQIASIGHLKDTSITEILKICSKFLNVALPWFSVGYRKLPGLVFSDVPCNLVLNFDYIKKTNKQITIAIYNNSGTSVKTLLANSYAAPGKQSYHFNLDIVNWPKGTYTLKVNEWEQEPMAKTFEL
jgi:hypothetical protein